MATYFVNMGGRTISYTPEKKSFVVQIAKGKGSFATVAERGLPLTAQASFHGLAKVAGQKRRLAFRDASGTIHNIITIND